METLDSIAGRFGVVADTGGFDESQSGSQVRRAARPDGTPVILKITIASSGWSRAAGERELAFYREVAPGLAVRTPELLDAYRTEDCIAILLTAHQALRPAPDWRHTDWMALAHDLAALHQTPVPDESWHRKGSASSSAADREQARDYWRGVERALELVDALFDDPEPLWSAAYGQAMVFGHGDCHSDNILVAESGLIWTDWQEAGMARPAGDLAFPSVRATPSGAILPMPEMIKEYAERRSLDPIQLERSVIAAELSTYLFVWPPYASYNSTAGVKRVHDRTMQLARNWLTG